MVSRIFVVLISMNFHHAIGGSEDIFLLNNHKLLGTLMEGYDSGLSPFNTHSTRYNGSLVDEPGATIISQLNFVRLIRVEEREQQIYTVLVIVTKWRDPRLKWDPAEFGGIDHIYVQADHIWHPEVAACDSSAYTPVLPDHAVFVKVNHTGHVVADRAYAVTYICEFDIAYFPFDKQSCDFCFFLPIYKPSELMLVGTFSDDLMVFDTPEWQLGDFSVHVQYKDKYELLTYNISMTRRAEFWVKMIIAPSFLIGCLILVGLLISVGEDAKSNAVNLGLTTMMSMTVILGILSDSIPKSKDLPVMGYFVLYEIIIIELAVVSVIYNKRISKNMQKITNTIVVFQRPKIVEEVDMNAINGEKRTVSSSIRRMLRRAFDWLQSVCSVRVFFFAFYLFLHFLNAIYLLSHYQGCWICIFEI